MRTVEVAEVSLVGRVVSAGAGKDGSFVRFQGAAGQVTVFVPETLASANGLLVAGKLLRVDFDIEQRGQSLFLRGYGVREEKVS